MLGFWGFFYCLNVYCTWRIVFSCLWPMTPKIITTKGSEGFSPHCHKCNEICTTKAKESRTKSLSCVLVSFTSLLPLSSAVCLCGTVTHSGTVSWSKYTSQTQIYTSTATKFVQNRKVCIYILFSFVEKHNSTCIIAFLCLIHLII